jgi:hypothetical protein
MTVGLAAIREEEQAAAAAAAAAGLRVASGSMMSGHAAPALR